MHPEVSEDLLAPGMEQGCVVLNSLWTGIIKELMYRELRGRTHANRRTYDAGCEGPACKKAVREHSRRRASVIAPNEKYRYLDPIIDFFFEEAKKKILISERKLIKELTA